MIKADYTEQGDLRLASFPSGLALFCLIFPFAGVYALMTGQAALFDVLLCVGIAAIPAFIMDHKTAVFNRKSQTLACFTRTLLTNNKITVPFSDIQQIREGQQKGGYSSAGLVEVVAFDQEFSITAGGSMGQKKRREITQLAEAFWLRETGQIQTEF